MEDLVLRTLSRQSYREAFLVAANSNERDLKAWLASGEYAPALSPNGIELQPFIKTQFSEALANDIQKHGYAFTETLQNLKIAHSNNRTAPWIAIKLYYAAFYAAHTLMRLFARSCSFLDHPVAAACNREIRGQLGPTAAPVSGGLTLLKLEQSGRVSITSLKDPHKDTWKHFSEMCDELSTKVSASSATSSEKTATIAFLAFIQEKLKLLNRKNGKGYVALSELRNRINYRYTPNIWHPNRRKAEEFVQFADALIRNVHTQSDNGINPKNELEALVDASTSMLKLSIHLIHENVRVTNERNTKLGKLDARILQVIGA